ncbi:MAG: hypothetical protein WDN23_14610 [Edaphobacter sp.]
MDPKISTCDDANDTLLFEQLQRYVLDHYPNPDRVGCLDSGTLAALVYTPESLELEDHKFLHIFKCAECTRELMTFRQERAQRTKELIATDGRKRRARRNIYAKAGMTMATLALCFALV